MSISFCIGLHSTRVNGTYSMQYLIEYYRKRGLPPRLGIGPKINSNCATSHLSRYAHQQESLANANVNARQPWYIGHPTQRIKSPLTCILHSHLNSISVVASQQREVVEFRGEVKLEETKVMGLLCGESCMILTPTVFD